MSYDISLRNSDGSVALVPGGHRLTGGTYALCGTNEAWLNVTYNYYEHFRRVLGEKGIRTIYGMTGQESVPVLEAAINALGIDRDLDYWKSTEGNARNALENLRLLALACPDATWSGD